MSDEIEQPHKKWFQHLFNSLHKGETVIEFPIDKIDNYLPNDFIKIFNSNDEENLIKILNTPNNEEEREKFNAETDKNRNRENDLILTNSKGIFAIVETKREGNDKSNKRFRMSFAIRQAEYYRCKFIKECNGVYKVGDILLDVITVIRP
ncbi:17840_t:CDS:2 [Dentiscutata erythropus]|uniref:17840_t:CDS:1 n=1 Tax=Dentiscutata erythropus TaxID=1348616 RepID=A0A9N8ZUP0_9GLOM|nr:17840_t:CDS:2 [Dentiscutata erythropus]